MPNYVHSGQCIYILYFSFFLKLQDYMKASDLTVLITTERMPRQTAFCSIEF